MDSKITMANTVTSAALALVIGVNPIAGALIGYASDKASTWGFRKVSEWNTFINTALALPENSPLKTAVKIATHLAGLVAYCAAAALILSIAGFAITTGDVVVLTVLPYLFMRLYGSGNQDEPTVRQRPVRSNDQLLVTT